MKKTLSAAICALVMLLIASIAVFAAPQGQTAPASDKGAEPRETPLVITSKAGIPRLTAKETRERTLSGQALLVCSYTKEKKFRKFAVEGAISLNTLAEMAPELPEGQEIIFYCACRGGGKALDQAVIYARQGFPTRIMEGGVRSWVREGYPDRFKR